MGGQNISSVTIKPVSNFRLELKVYKIVCHQYTWIYNATADNMRPRVSLILATPLDEHM